jgi:hypothetical protein
VVCCALPVLLSAWVVTTLAGIGLRNWLIVLVGGLLAMFGLLRLLRCQEAASPPAKTHMPTSSTTSRLHHPSNQSDSDW